MSWLYSLPPPPQSGINPALFVLEKAELALRAELPELQPAPAGNCATGYCLLAFFCSLLKGEPSNLCTGAHAVGMCILTYSACTGQCSLSGLKLTALLGAARMQAPL